MTDARDQARPPPDHQKQLVQLITELGYRHSHWQVFADFVEMGAISMSNAVDLGPREQREHTRCCSREGVASPPFRFAAEVLYGGDSFKIAAAHHRSHLSRLCPINGRQVTPLM
jgi:hypothetical protein